MILYKSDWSIHKGVSVHVNTTNKTFIKMHHIFKDMGIENNAFFLALHDPLLADINPHDIDSITPELAGRIAAEAKINPWYYLRELVRVPATGTEAIPFKLNRAALFMYWSFFNSINLFLIQPRQTGKTITSETLMVNLTYILYKNTRIKLFTHDTKLVHENIEKFKSIRDELPQYLLMLDKNKDTENKEEIKYHGNALFNNTYTTKVAQASIAGAFTAGRGGTVLVNQFDEMPFCENIAISYPVLMNAKNMATMHAREHHIPFADIITTTAAKLDTDSGAYAYDIMRKCLAFSEHFYDLGSHAEMKQLLKLGSKNNMLYAEYSYRQLEFTREWADQIVIENNLDEDSVKRDLENTWTSGSARPAVDAALLDEISNFKSDPIEIQIVNDYVFKWYEPREDIWKDKDRFFAIGLDTSENIAEDFTSVHMCDIADLSTVMTSRCNDQDVIYLGEYIADILVAHPNVILIPERKSTATVLIQIICKKLWDVGINPFTRIYNKVFQNRSEAPFSKMDVSGTYASEGPTKKYIGYATAATGDNSRNALYKLTLNRALKMCPDKIRDKNLIQELKTLTLSQMGRIDHLATKHDDSVVAYMLAAWFVIHGKNHHLYGIPNHIKLSRVAADGKTVDVSKSHRQRTLSIRINELNHQIRNTTDLIVRSSLEQERNLLKIQLDTLGPEISAIQSIGDLQQSNRRIESLEDQTRELSYMRVKNDHQKRLEQMARDPFKRNRHWDTM